MPRTPHAAPDQRYVNYRSQIEDFFFTITCLTLTPHPPGVILSDGSLIAGDLVIDASGRGSKAAEWIAAAGYAAPEVQVVNCESRYTTALYELDEDYLAKVAPTNQWWIMQFYPYTSSAAILPVEGKRWQVRRVLWRGQHGVSEVQRVAS
jgi:hypothetical protein